MLTVTGDSPDLPHGRFLVPTLQNLQHESGQSIGVVLKGPFAVQEWDYLMPLSISGDTQD